MVSATIRKVVLYGPQHDLSKHFCRPDFNGRNVSDLQNEFIQGGDGEL